jgi:hypothetical protein
MKRFTTVGLLALVLTLSVVSQTSIHADRHRTTSNRTPIYWAEILVSELKPEDTDYQHKGGFINWKGELGATEYESRTDCSGFVNLLLARSYGLTEDDFKRWLGKRRPLAIDYFAAISGQQNFRLIANIRDVKADDIIAVRYPPGTNENTGHIMLVASAPVSHTSTKPIVDGTEQWELSIIDSSESGHGKADTRHRPDATFNQGVGKGTLRLYTIPNGEIVGYSWSPQVVSEYYDRTSRQLMIGRLQLPIK